MARRPSPVVEPEPLEVLELRAARPGLAPRSITRLGVYALVLVLLGAVAGWAVASSGDTVHAARAEVLYELTGDQSSGFLREDRQLTTQVVTLRSRAVLAPVAAANDLTVEELSEKLHVRVVQGSEVLRIDVEDRSADRARTLAAGVTETYLAQYRPEGPREARRFLRKEIAGVDERRAELTFRMIQLEQQRLSREDPPSEPGAEETAIRAEIGGLLEQRTQLLAQLEDVAVDDFRAPRVEQITDAFVLDDPVSPRPVQGAAAGAVAGALVAAAVIAVLVRRRSPA